MRQQYDEASNPLSISGRQRLKGLSESFSSKIFGLPNGDDATAGVHQTLKLIRGSRPQAPLDVR